MSHFYTVNLPLSESQEIGPNAPLDTDATGMADISYDPDSGELTITGSFADLSSDLLPIGGADSSGAPESPIHVHVGGVGQGGPIVFNLDVQDDGDGSGTFSRTIAITEEQRDLFEAGGYYINLHTVNNPSGELRGQTTVDSTQFDIVDAENEMSEAQEGPNGPDDGPATGNTSILFDGATNTLQVDGTFSGLSSDLLDIGGVDGAGNPESAIHLHSAPAGTNGPIIRNLAVTDNGDGSGSFTGRYVLTDEEAADLRADAIYVNLHTVDNASGEIRGQLTTEQEIGDIVTTGISMSEDQQPTNTPAPGPATGRIDVALDAETMTLTVEGTFSGLTSDLMPVGGTDSAGNPESAIHIHEAREGSNGPIFRNLEVTDNGDGSGSFRGSFQLADMDEAREFAADGYYVNLHTVDNPSGELRGQIDLDSGIFDDVTIGTPMSEAQEVGDMPVEDTDATGSFTTTFDSATGVFTVDGAYSDLTSDLMPVGGADAFGNDESAIHLHFGDPGENGPILFNLDVDEETDSSGTFSGSIVVPEDRIADFDADRYYVNLHTDDNPGGELRGQIDLSSAIQDRTVVRNEIAGSLGDDILSGTDGNDIIRGLTGDDEIAASGGDDFVDGGAGFDTFVFDEDSSTLSAVIDGDGQATVTGTNSGIVSEAVNVEAVGLSDGVLRLDVGAGQAAGTASRLYDVLLDRDGDAAGEAFWTGTLDDGASAVAVTDAFISSGEFADEFGADLSDTAFLNVLYQNLRGTDGDAAGLDFWTDALGDGFSRAATALEFVDSAEAQENFALDGGVFLADGGLVM